MRCAFCFGLGTEIIDFGSQALAGGYLTREQFMEEKKYPLKLYFCEGCFAVQVGEHVDPAVLFSNYRYFSSATQTASEHFGRYAEGVLRQFKPKTVFEIGCNDGVLLRHMAGKVDTLVGIDPAENVTRGIRDPRVKVVNGFFDPDTAERVKAVYGLADVVIANNVFAHVSDIHGITRAVRDAMKDDGVFIIEVHDLGEMIGRLQYDWIYHEHLYYYSLLSLEKHFASHGMQIFDVESLAIHGGSRRYYVCKDGRHQHHSVGDKRGLDRLHGLDRLDTMQDFAWRAEKHAKQLHTTLKGLRQSGRVLGGYGASGRASALIQHAEIGEFLHCMFDDAPAKKGLFTPGSHLHINEGKTLVDASVPDDIVLFAWSYLDEVSKRCVGFRGNVIVPLPDLRMRRFFVQDGQRMVM